MRVRTAVQLGVCMVSLGLFGLFLSYYLRTVPIVLEDSSETTLVSKIHKHRDFGSLTNNTHRSQSGVIRMQDRRRDVPGERSESDPRPRSVNITIVDERQRALLYWMEAVRTGSLPATGVSLIRFDKHSNLAVPNLLENYPLYKTPTVESVAYLLQSNSQYLMAAVFAGLIREIIWIWPKWDFVTHFSEYSLSMMQAGTVTKGKGRNFCLCMFDSESSENTCFYNSMTDSESGVVHMDLLDCDVRRTVKYVEIREDKAVNYLRRRREGNRGRADTILDIDVDFLNYLDTGEALIRANIGSDIVLDMDSNLSRLLCPRGGEQETKMDKLISEFVNSVKKQKLKQPKTKSDFSQIYKYGVRFFRDQFVRWSLYACPVTVEQRALFVSRFVRSVASLHGRQLAVLGDTGFCLSSVRQSLKELPEKKFTVCTGDSFMTKGLNLHLSTTGLRSRLRNFRAAVSEIANFPTRLVTFSRSVRDGFTNRTLEIHIEKLVLSILQSELSNTKVYYDTDLLGGKEGFKKKTRVF